MEMEVVSGGVATSSSAEVKVTAASRREKESVEEKTVPIQQEILAAEEFERTSACDVEFEFQID